MGSLFVHTVYLGAQTLVVLTVYLVVSIIYLAILECRQLIRLVGCQAYSLNILKLFIGCLHHGLNVNTFCLMFKLSVWVSGLHVIDVLSRYLSFYLSAWTVGLGILSVLPCIVVCLYRLSIWVPQYSFRMSRLSSWLFRLSVYVCRMSVWLSKPPIWIVGHSIEVSKLLSACWTVGLGVQSVLSCRPLVCPPDPLFHGLNILSRFLNYLAGCLDCICKCVACLSDCLYQPPLCLHNRSGCL